MLKERKTIQYRKSPTEKLTEQQKEFCRQYASGQCGADAGRLAGYSESWCHSNAYAALKKPAIRTYIEILKNKQMQRTDIDPEFVLKTLKRLIDKAELDGRYEAAIKATELIGKHYQMFKDVSRQEIEMSGRNNPFSTGKSDVAKRADLHRLVRVTGLQNKSQEALDEKEAADDETIN